MDEAWMQRKAHLAPRRKLQLGKFIRQNPEIAFKALVLLFAVVMLLTVTITKATTRRAVRAEMEAEFEARRMTVVEETTEAVRTELGYYAAQDENAVMNAEAEEIAKVLYGMQYNSADGLKSATWCVLNRVDNSQYPDTIEGVCNQEKQWVGFSESNPVLINLKQIALEQVEVWHSGVRPMGANYVFLEWSPSEIVLKDAFSGSCHKWFEEDWN